jgi:hypothetical protein
MYPHPEILNVRYSGHCASTEQKINNVWFLENFYEINNNRLINNTFFNQTYQSA